MKSVVFINPGHDTAGAGYAMKSAFDAESDWTARAICRNETYLRYPTDIVWTARDKSKRMVDLLEAADVVHAMNSPRPLGWFQSPPGQTLVVHHLGTTFRREPEAMSAICREYGAIEVTDSVDLLLGPHIGWLPIPADLEALARLREERYARNKSEGTLRIAHAPTDREYKDTEAIQAAVESLSRKYPVRFDLIEKVTNRECLARKAQADIFVDQLKYGFGLNAIECWAMGIPVVSGFTDQSATKRARAMFGRLPWVDATAKTLEGVIEHLIVDENWRARLGQRGREHAEQWHSQESVVRQTLTIYGQ